MSPVVPNVIACWVADVLVLYVQIPAPETMLYTPASVLPSPLKSPGAIFAAAVSAKSEYEPPLLFLTLKSVLATRQRPISALPSLSKSKSTTLVGCGGAAGAALVVAIEDDGFRKARSGAKSANVRSRNDGNFAFSKPAGILGRATAFRSAANATELLKAATNGVVSSAGNGSKFVSR
jgi:hypothetical protein